MSDVSIIICTRDRQDALARCLASATHAAMASTLFEVEIVLVDDGSVDGTSEFATDLARHSVVPLSVIHGAGAGLSAARNAGLARASGDILIFVDDDCLLSADYIEQACRHFAADTELVLRGGRVELADPLDAALTIKTSLNPARLPLGEHPGGFILGCNMAMRRAVVDAVGLFDERFGAGGLLRSAEDTDYLLRAHLAGVVVEYVPDMVVFHAHGRRTREQVAKVQRDYRIGDGALSLKHIRHAPWLLRIHYWAARNAAREVLGGPRYDPDWGLSHRRLVFHNLVGGLLFLIAKLERRPAFPPEAATAAARPRRRPASARGAPQTAPASWRDAPAGLAPAPGGAAPEPSLP